MLYIEEIIKRVTEEMICKKNEIIAQRLTEKGYDPSILNPEGTRFKKLAVEMDGDFERWYADDGTPSGDLIITFKIETSNMITSGVNGHSFETKLSYF